MAGKLRWRSGWVAALAGLLVLGPAVGAAGGAARAAGAPAVRTAFLHAGQTGPRSAVPWRKVGAGWVLAISWPGSFGSPGKPRAAVPVLYLYSPAGGRYRIFRWLKTKRPPFLEDWSGDKARALVLTGSEAQEQIVLATGRIRPVRLPQQEQVVGYTRPTGQGLLAWRASFTSTHVRFARYNLDGRRVKLLTSGAANVSAVYSRSGAVLAVGAQQGIWLVSNNGGIRRKLPVPGTDAGCRPSRWWNSRTILASCKVAMKSHGRLWLVPAGGGRPRPLTAQRPKHGIDPGDIGAWRSRGSVYLQALARSGRELIFKQLAGRPPVAVPVPHLPSSDAIVASHGSRLLIVADDICANHASLLWFNPVTGREQLLINTRSSLVGVLGVVPFGQPLAQFFVAVACAADARRMVRS